MSYTGGHLSLEWSSPDACPRDGDYEGEPNNGGSGSDDNSGGGQGGGWGFFGVMKFLFWMTLLGLIGYFAIGQLSEALDWHNPNLEEADRA